MLLPDTIQLSPNNEKHANPVVRKLFLKSQIVNIFSFAGHMVFVVAIQC